MKDLQDAIAELRRGDGRIVYGARCTWWDSIGAAGTRSTFLGDVGRPGLPCCPHCRGVLLEVSSEAAWWAGVEEHEAGGHPGYRSMIEWARGKCFANFDLLRAAWEISNLPESPLLFELTVERHGHGDVLIRAECCCGERATFDSGQVGEGYVRPAEHLPHHVLGDWIAGHAYCNEAGE